MKKTIRNKIDEAGLITLDVSDLVPVGSRAKIDIVDWLDNHLIIKEVSFKLKLEKFNWDSLKDSFVSVTCSNNVIVPPWAYLLIQMKLRNIAKQVFFCDTKEMETLLFQQKITKMNFLEYKNKRVFLKVCGNKEVPLSALSMCAHALSPHVKSLFYGEPCSSVPLIKN